MFLQIELKTIQERTEMMHHKMKSLKSLFNNGILRTFGKINQQDIEEIDGSPERLVTHLMERYGWLPEKAQSKVDGFRASLSPESK